MKNRGITLISLVITIIVLIILASVAISLSLGKSGIFNRAKWAKEKYEVAQIRETVEIGILDSQLQRETVNEKLTIEGALQDLAENKIFESIDKQEQLGYIGEYEVKLKYNEDNTVVIEYIQKSTGIRVTYTLDPIGYTNTEKVNILLKVEGKVKSITKPDGLKIYPKNEIVGIDYGVTANGKYKFIIEKEDGTIKEKEAIVDTIDMLEPKDFEIIAEVKTGKIVITANVEDREADDTSVKSGIEKIEYYIKLTAASDYIKYDSNEIKGLPSGTYNVYAICYDKAGNTKQSGVKTIDVVQWIEIWNEQDLRDIANGLNKNYILMTDIELTQEWIPIGESFNSMFEGKFDGNMHTISNLNINITDERAYEGMFAYTGYNSKIYNLIIENAQVNNLYGGAGILAGYSLGEIKNVSVSGSVKGSHHVRRISSSTRRRKYTNVQNEWQCCIRKKK